jgi:diguanylate cyclase (GGDEF)-like protein/PAS domain S-box-containing protein
MTFHDEPGPGRLDAERDAMTRALKLLSDCSMVLIHAETEQEFLEAICRLAVETGDYLMAWIGFAEQDAARSISYRASSGYEAGYLQSVAISWSDDASGQGPVGTAIRTGATIVNNDYRTNPDMRPWSAAASQRGYRSSIALPLKVRNRVIGVFSTYAADPFSFSAAEVRLLEELAGNLSYGIEAIRNRAEREAAQTALKKENEKNLALLRNASDGIHILDIAGNLIEASDAFCAMLGYSRDDMIGMNVAQWDAHFTEAGLAQHVSRQFGSPGRSQFESTHRRKDGSLLDVEVSGAAMELDGRPVLFNSSRDITERKQADKRLQEKQEELFKSEAQYRELIRNLHVAIVVHTPDTRIVFSNPRASELLGLSEDQMRGKVAIDPAWHFIDEQEKPMPLADYPVNRVIKAMNPIEALVLGVKFPNTARVTWLLVNAFPELDADGSLKRVVVNFDDITARKRAEAKIHHLAFFDALTRLPNRRLLMDRFHSALTVSARSNLYGAVLFIDMDRFKTVNDVLGHDFGDLLLIEVANRIRSCVREGDTVARWGGDEFVVLLAGIDEHIEAASQKTALIAAKIRACLTQPYLLKTVEQHSSSSIGVAMYRGNGDAPDVVLRQADIAMYKAKDAGRNAVRFFNPEMQLAVELHAALEADLRHAVPERQLRLHYQIQVDTDQRPMGAEALVRWEHPRRGMVSPLSFIPIAEESSLILDIGGWVLQTACRQLAAWRQQPRTRHLSLSVNVSAQQFRQADFVDMLAALLREHDIDASRLKLELTESVVLTDIGDVVTRMRALKALGVKLSMDDFGTGYSSLAYLKQLPLDEIKIDQSFVRDIISDPNDAVMVKTIIDLGTNFGLGVIAEGVETEAQLAFLKHHGCIAYQGYLFSKPVPVEAFEVLLTHLP